ncbi:Uncharacterised protein g9612 [Pycnogonum litorale]
MNLSTRKFVVFLNVIVSLLGVASFSLGIVLKVWRKGILQKLSGPHLGIIFTGIEVTMVMNVLVIAISMVCAIVCFRRETARRFTIPTSFGNKVLLWIWMLCNLVVILSNVILSIVFVAKYPYDLDDDYGDEFIRAIGKYENGGDLKRIIDENQIKNRCCGWYSYKDWLSADWIPNLRDRGGAVPFSCCNVSFPRRCLNYKITKSNVDDIHESIYHGGCSEILMSWWKELFYSIASIIFIIAFLQVLTACLIRVLRRTDCDGDDDDNSPKLKRRLRCLFGCLRRRDDVDIEAASKRRRRRNINVDTSGSLNEFDEISQSSTENRDEPVDFDGIKSKVERKCDERLQPRRSFANGKRRKTLGVRKGLPAKKIRTPTKGVRKRLPAKKIRTPTKGVSRIKGIKKGIKKGKILKMKKRF